MPPHEALARVNRPAREFAEARLAERIRAILDAVHQPVTCVDGRVYAGRRVYRADARRYDDGRDRAVRWC